MTAKHARARHANVLTQEIELAISF